MDQMANRLFHLSGRYMHTVARCGALPQGQMMALKYLREHPAATPTDLSLAFSIRPPTVTPILRRLEGKGYLRRVHSLEDRRRVELTITAQGLAALADGEARLLERYGSLLRRLSPGEARELLRLLEKISDPPDADFDEKGRKP